MIEYEVYFRPRARKDLISVYRYIAQHSSPRVAGNYILRIEKICLSLAIFPERGTAVPGKDTSLRTIGFERRATILFRVDAQRVEVLRILYGGRDLGFIRKEESSS